MPESRVTVPPGLHTPQMSVLIKARFQIDMRSALMESDRVAGDGVAGRVALEEKLYKIYLYIYEIFLALSDPPVVSLKGYWRVRFVLVM